MYSSRENQSRALQHTEKPRQRFDSLPLSHEPRVWPGSPRPEVYPYQVAIDANEHNKSNSRLDPTLAYPVPLRPSVFQHARFIDKMQPGTTRVNVKQEKYEVFQEEPLKDADPRKWSREDVSRWLQWMSEVFNLNSVRPDRFQMNGKALCLMTVDMFLYRVPEGGNILYQDFQRRLRNAVALQN
ncbi:GA-binding protein alpha chain-like [Montipora capricornis]|uniref:GA-binding protein alpha chain-like n=1 Tax=Montipora foliosa TaxID=591990 RepID=UPI0035F1A209